MPEVLNSKRIAKNSLLLYIRMLFIMAVKLYTSRVILSTLGVEDYGLYNVVGGIVIMFDFLNNAMSTSTLRYITFELGRGNIKQLQKVFVCSVNIHIIISVVVIILSETIGLWILTNKMIIPHERFNAAMWVYQISIFTSVISIMNCPYNSTIIAHEKMSTFAYISIVEVVLKLLIVYMLTISDFDKLILYSLLIALTQIFIRFIYSQYCLQHFKETKYKYIFDKSLFKEMLSFASWNLVGNLAGSLATQGQNLLLNIFFGPAVNAARALSIQVQGIAYQFTSGFQMALNPQITKSYSVGDLESMHKLIFRSSKFSFILLLILSTPIIIECSSILSIWLNNVPEYTIEFLRIILVISLVDSTANPLMISAAATGKIKRYQLIIGGIVMMILPLTYIAFKLGAQPWFAFMIHLLICCIAYIGRLILLQQMINLSIITFIKKVLVRCAIIVVPSFLLPIILKFFLGSESIWASFIIIIFSIITVIISSFYWGLSTDERIFIRNRFDDIVLKIKNLNL